MKEEVAEKLSVLLLQINAKLNDSVALVRDTCTNEEFETFRTEIGKIMGGLFLEVAERLYREHPLLRPEQLNGTYKVDPKIFEPRFYEWK
jgi:hypothetical protein